MEFQTKQLTILKGGQMTETARFKGASLILNRMSHWRIGHPIPDSTIPCDVGWSR